MFHFRHRKRLSLLLAVMMIVTSLEVRQPVTALAEDTGGTAAGTEVTTPEDTKVESVTGSALETVSGSALHFEDPVTVDMIGSGILTIDQVYAAGTGTVVTVIGQVSYIYGSLGVADTALIEDIINNEIIGLQIYDKNNISKYHVGDVVEVTGKVGIYGGVCQLINTTVTEKGTKTAFPAQELTISQLLSGGDSYISELVRIKNAVIGAYSATKPFNTPVQDSSGSANIYKAADYSPVLAEGETADITAAFSKYNSSYQLRNLSGADYIKVTPPAVSAEVPVFSPDSEEVPLGQKISIVSSTSGSAIHISVNSKAETLYDEANQPVIDAFPYTITAYATKAGLSDSAAATKTYTQARVAPVEANESGSVKPGTKLLLSTQTAASAIFYSLNSGASWESYDPAAGIILSTLPVTVLTKATKAGYLDSDVNTLNFTKKPEGSYQLYFGQLHAHTSYSDGSGTCAQAFDYAKNTAKNIDFLAVTDHSNSFDNAANATILDGSMSTEWTQGHQLADQYTDSSFVGIYGYEMTWSNGLGHMNTFNTAGFQNRDQANYTDYAAALPNYYAALKQDTDSISQFNHPGTTFGDFNDFANYDESIDKLISLIEVGNGEGAVGSSGYFASYEYYTRALDKGWHVAPTNNQDNHHGLWGDANTARTVVLADTLTRSGIYDALRNMRVYATEDNDLEIQYTLNGEALGTVMASEPSSVSIKVDLKDPTDTAVGKVEVIVNSGLVAASRTVNDNEETVTFALPADYSYYYIRVTQNDGDKAVTAPVWIKDVEAAGISKLSTAEKLQIKGETLRINTELFNNEPSLLAVKSMDFSVNDTVIHTVDINGAGLTELTSGTTKTYSFDYTCNSIGAVNVKVTVHAVLNGVDKVYSSILKLNYTDPAMVTRVIVDGTHYNDYVTGYYGDNFGNVTEIAADNNTRITIVKDAITEDILADCDLLIISAPAKKSGTANAGTYSTSHFDDSFLNLVKNYTARGGDIIICGLADYQDTVNGQSSTEMNKLLEAINATTRINSDEAYDMDNNGGQAFRLYLTNYNTASAFTSGVAADQLYSAYSGCTVLLDSASVNTGEAEYLVKGHPTTYSIDSKAFGGNYSTVTKGDAVLLARETLASGSKVFISGTVFMSNYEIKAAVDNATDKAYSNRMIMENILASVKKRLPVSSIASVRSGAKGSVYCVEGTVTSGTVSGNAFFDTIYIQDATSGINIFPVNQGLIEVGQKVKVTGYLDEYLGDLELRVVSAEVTDTNKVPIEPAELTAKDAMDYTANGGKLVKIQGAVTDVTKKNDQIETILVKDSSGVTARIFLDGYIGYSDAAAPKLESFVSAGKIISAVCLVSYDSEGVRLRVRDRSEIIDKTPAPTPSTPATPTPTTPTPTPTPSTPATPIPTTPTPTPTPSTTPISTATPTTPVPTAATVPTVTPTPTIDPGTTPVLILTDVVLTQKNKDITATMMATKSKGHIAAQVGVDADELLRKAGAEGSFDKPLPFSLELSSKELIRELAEEDVKSLSISVTLPEGILDNDRIEMHGITIDADLLKAAGAKKRKLSVIVKDKDGRERYSWSFDGDEPAKNQSDIADLNMAMSVEQLSAYQGQLPGKVNKKGLVFQFRQEGTLPAPAYVKVYIGDLVGVRSGNGLNINRRAYLYYINKKTGKLDSLPFGTGYRIDQDGYITIAIIHCSDYVLMAKAADSSGITPLKDQITASIDKQTLSAKGTNQTVQIKLQLPVTLELVSNLQSRTSNDAIGGVIVSYKSGNKKIATVDRNGKITAVAPGKVTITVTLRLYNGTSKVLRYKITVKQ